MYSTAFLYKNCTNIYVIIQHLMTFRIYQIHIIHKIKCIKTHWIYNCVAVLERWLNLSCFLNIAKNASNLYSYKVPQNNIFESYHWLPNQIQKEYIKCIIYIFELVKFWGENANFKCDSQGVRYLSEWMSLIWQKKNHW